MAENKKNENEVNWEDENSKWNDNFEISSNNEILKFVEFKFCEILIWEISNSFDALKEFSIVCLIWEKELFSKDIKRSSNVISQFESMKLFESINWKFDSILSCWIILQIISVSFIVISIIFFCVDIFYFIFILFLFCWFDWNNENEEEMGNNEEEMGNFLFYPFLGFFGQTVKRGVGRKFEMEIWNFRFIRRRTERNQSKYEEIY